MPMPLPHARIARSAGRALLGLLVGLWLALGAEAGAQRLRVGTSGDYPPFSVAGRGGEYSGFDVMVARAYAEERGLTLELVSFRWPRLLTALAEGRFDVAMSGITVRPERSAAGRFSVPVVETGAVVLVRDPERWGGLTSLDTRAARVGVNAGGHLEQVTRQKLPRATLIAIPQNDAVLTALLSGSVDAVVTEEVEAALWTGKIRRSAVYGPFTRDRKAYLVRSDRAELAADLDAWLLAREADGTLAALRAEHLGDAPPEGAATPLAALLAAVDERLALMPLLALAKREQGLPLEVPEREAVVLDQAVAAAAAAAAQAGRPPLPQPALRAFFEAEIEAAKQVQRASVADERFSPPLPLPDAEEELRPALLRIDERTARLLLMLPADLDAEKVRAAARDALRAPYLDAAQVVALADAIAHLVSARAASPATTGSASDTP